MSVVSPDQVSIGVLVDAVPRDPVDEAVAVCGVRERRSDGKLPAHVITYLTLGLCLFPDDDYEEVAAKVRAARRRAPCPRLEGRNQGAVLLAAGGVRAGVVPRTPPGRAGRQGTGDLAGHLLPVPGRGHRRARAQAPNLHHALRQVAEAGWSHVVLEGKVIDCDRLAETKTSKKGKLIDAWYSGKTHGFGGNIQAVMRPDGLPIWIGDVEAGSVHDLTAARTHVLGALYWAASQLTVPPPEYPPRTNTNPQAISLTEH